MPANATANGPLKSNVILHLYDRPGELVSWQEIATAFACSEVQAMNALSSVKRDQDKLSPGSVERVYQGVYRYNPGASSSTDNDVIFTVIKDLGNDRRLVEDESGDLFVISRLEV